MKKITLICKDNCPPCLALKEYIKTLDKIFLDKIFILDESNTSLEDLKNIIISYNKNSFPTIILSENGLEDIVLNGFGEIVKQKIKNFF